MTAPHPSRQQSLTRRRCRRGGRRVVPFAERLRPAAVRDGPVPARTGRAHLGRREDVAVCIVGESRAQSGHRALCSQSSEILRRRDEAAGGRAECESLGVCSSSYRGGLISALARAARLARSPGCSSTAQKAMR